ncbi:hypothetical protein K438DRAFT_637437 [Mycena galopus ATCC 62051]|nr:hypothetical protein K438DRAFT_637437 [Mycena galopus ATCC 62051]
MGTRAASALCDIPIPGVNILKPVIGIVSLICDTAKTVNGNRAAALALARHAKDVTNSIVEKVSNGEKDADSLAALRLTLEEVQTFLELLRSRRRVASWILAAKDKDRFTELSSALDRALAVFCSALSIGITTTVRGNTQELATLVATVHRVEDDVKRTMTQSDRIHATNTAFVPHLINSRSHFFFLDLEDRCYVQPRCGHNGLYGVRGFGE